MGLASRLASWWLGRSESGTANPQQWFIDWVRGGAESASGIAVSQLSALQASTVLACVSIRAGDIAKMPVHVYRTRKDGGRDIIENHALERILQKPNDWQTRFEFIEQMHAALLLRSNAYAPIIRDGRARPIAMIPVNPDRVQMYEAPDGSLYYRVTWENEHEKAALGDLPDLISAADMLHLRWMSLNGLTGLSRIGLAKDAIGLARVQEIVQARLFRNNARPSGVLQSDKQLNDKVIDRLRAQWQSVYGGTENTGRIAILEEGLKWEPLTMNFVDAEFMKGRDFQVQEIARIFDVPLHRLGTMQQGGGTAMLQAHQMYLNNTVSTDAERWEAKLNDIFGLDGENEYVEFDLDYFNRADINNRMLAYRTGVIGMILTPNEARRREGLPDVKGGGVLYQPTNVAPIGFKPAGKEPGPGSDVTGAPAQGGDGDMSAPESMDENMGASTDG